jgi:phosphoacetylglucosamine mutase
MNYTQLQDFLSTLPVTNKYYSYGTAGFRDKYTDAMHIVFVKVGILAALRSLNMNQQAIGVMITASHNPKEDNGVKIVDPDGGMLTQSWENTAELLVNSTLDVFITELQKFIVQLDLSVHNKRPLVVIGADCRDSSPILCDFVKKGVELIVNGLCLSIGQATTPLLHYVVADINKDNSFSTTSQEEFNASKYISAYFDDLYYGFNDLVSTIQHNTSTGSPNEKRKKFPLILDTAYGVGSITTNQFLAYLASKVKENEAGEGPLPYWNIVIRNEVSEGPVNEDCGAEHCQKLQKPPANMEAEKDNSQLLCSFDGDADRIVFHTFLSSNPSSWTLLDGDRIASLIALFLAVELNEAELFSKGIDVGIVQTAYANGSSTYFIKSQKIPIYITKTGVKFLHHKAHELDVGIYFEANGHGTVLFSKKFRNILEEEIKNSHSSSDKPRKLLALRRLQVRLLDV